MAAPLLLWLGGCAAAPDSRPFVSDASTLTSRQTAALNASAVTPQATVAGLGQDQASETGNENLEHPRPREIAAVPGVVMVESAVDKAANRQQLASLQTMITQRNPFLGNVANPR